MKFLIINGPNINMLGIREPDVYGKRTYSDLCDLIDAACGDDPHEVFQSNHEGAIVDKIQEAYGKFDAIVINPAAYTHTSIAIPDALRAVSLPVAEVHISDISVREEYRRVSYVSPIAETVISGHGINGYAEAINYLRKKYRNE